jgi:hypothetical protein
MNVKFLVAGLLILFFIKAYPQDVIVMKTGDEVQVKVLEILPDVVKYKKYNNQDGPTYSEYKTNIFMIKYQNGSKDVFGNQQSSTSNTSTTSTNNNESQAVNVLQSYFINGFKNSSKKTFNLLDFKKTNGIMRNVNGQSMYEVQFNIVVQFAVDAWLKGNGMEGYWTTNFRAYTAKPDLSATGENYTYTLQFNPRGTTVMLGCVAELGSTDNGFKIQSWDIKTVTNLGAKPLQNGLTQVQQTSSQNSGRDAQTASDATPASNVSVDVSKYAGIIYGSSNVYYFKISDIQAYDELNNNSEIKSKILDVLSQIKRISHTVPDGPMDTLTFNANLGMSYREYPRNGSTTFFADCVFDMSFTDTKTHQQLFHNSYKATNYNILSAGYASKLDAGRNLISNKLLQPLSQFIVGNFPLTGEITDIIEKNKKQDEAKAVKINIGRNQGVLIGYGFYISSINQNTTKSDLIVKEAYDDYSICKVVNNEKEILQLKSTAQKLKVQSIYRP